MKLKHYSSFDEWYDDLTDSDPYPGVDVRLNLSKGPTSQDLRQAADDIDGSCCGVAEGLAVVAGDVYYRYVDFGH